MMNQQVAPLGYLALSVAGTTSTGFTQQTVAGTTTFVLPTAANVVLLAANGGAVRWRDDGTAPDITSGMILNPGLAPFEYSGNISMLRFTGVTGTVAVDCAFYKVAG